MALEDFNSFIRNGNDTPIIKCSELLCSKAYCGTSAISKNKEDIIINEEN